MRSDFHTASLIDMQLPVSLKEKLWREGAVTNAPLMDILSKASQGYLSSEIEASDFVADAVNRASIAKTYAPEFFRYRKGTIPDEVMYTAVAGEFIAAAPELFPALPSGYPHLRNELNVLDTKPEAISSIHYSPQAKFNHYINCMIELRSYLVDLRSGHCDVSDFSVQERYRRTVPHVKNDFNVGTKIVEDIRKTSQNIDYIFNHYHDDFAWYVQTAATEKQNVLNPGFVFSETNLPDTGRIKEIFELVYGYYKTKNNNDGYAAYYEFSEKVLSPLSIFSTCFKNGMSEKSVLYALSNSTLSGPDAESFSELYANDNNMENFRNFHGMKISAVSMDVLKTSTALSDLIFHTMQIWGSHHQPFIFLEQLLEFHEKLLATDDLKYQNLPMEPIFVRYRALASDTYNRLVDLNKSLELPHYAPPSPVN